ncbi:Hypothetical predicted protein [Mytilus galloprovincialis]|nr:Hypothetical predicted protein [Mytilus galloprovincialis]
MGYYVEFLLLFVDYTQFEKREKIEGIQILMRPKIDEIEEPDKLKATEWLKGMCLKPLFDKGIPGLTSLAKSLLISCKYENVEIESVQEDDLEKRLTTGMDIKLQSTTFNKCIPDNLYNNEREFKKMNKLYLGLPLCVLHASENLKVNIRIICFPSREVVIFYNQKRNFTIHLGLIGQETYVPLIKITEDDQDTMSGLIATIKMLRATIKDLKETKTKTEKEKQDLLKKIEKIEKQLEEKEEEYKSMKQHMSEKARIKIRKTAEAVARRVAEQCANEYDNELNDELDF